MNKDGLRFLLLLVLILASKVHAEEAEAELPNVSTDRLSSLIQKTLETKIPHSEIKLPSLSKVIATLESQGLVKINSVKLIDDKPTGVVMVEVSGNNEAGSVVSPVIQTPYEAWVKVPVATHRIFPNTKLKTDDIRIDRINVATGSVREYRGVLQSPDAAFDHMESRQTILENQFVTTSALQKQPDLRRGDTVKLELISGELILVTQGTIQEPASVGDHVRVITSKTKREIVGVVKEDHSVEVNL